VALLSVMFILVLVSTLAIYVAEADHLMLRRAGNIRDLEQGMQLALGGEQWAERVLQRDAAEGETDYLGEAWNSLGGAVTVDDAALRTVVTDLQGRFNLNNLTQRDEVWYPAFKRLLRLLDIDEGLAEAVVDWLDPDQQRTHADGAEDLEYLLLDPPYRAANRPMSDVGEMRLINGVTEDVLDRLAPFVSVTPDGRPTRINVNTCPPLLFQILGETLDAAAAESLANARGDVGFESIEAFLQRPELAGEANRTAEPMVGLASEYFQVTNQVKIGRINLATDSVVRRNNADSSVGVIARGWGFL
jgi:general secretion pathway protein K